MAKNALVIKGANFAANKLTTVTFIEDEKPCTAIELSDSSKTVTEMGIFTLTATVTPVDTTDDVLWASSNESVATVTGGVVTVLGLGSATITAICGEQTATCTVTCNEVTVTPYYMFATIAGSSAQSSYPNAYPIVTSNRDLTAGDNTNNTRKLKNQSSSMALNASPILLPANTGIVELTYGSDMRSGTIYFAWMDTARAAGDTRDLPDCAYKVSLDTTHESAYNTPKTWQYDVPSGANSFAISMHTNSTDFSESDTPSGVATAKGIVIKCKPAAS